MCRPIAVAAVLGCWAAPLAAQGLSYEGGLFGTTGKYIFTERTTSLSLSTGVAWTIGSVTLRASLPAILQNTTLLTTAGGGMGAIPSGGSRGSGAVSDSGTSRRGGGRMMPATAISMAGGRAPVQAASAISDYRAAVGDPTVGLNWRALSTGRLIVTAGGAVKLPLSDTTNFGTGEWDYAATAGVTARMSQRLSLGADLSYWLLGDLPALDFANPLFGTVTLSTRVNDQWIAGGMVSGGTSALRGFPAPWSVGATMFRSSGTGQGFGLTAAAGLSETAPDFSLGLLWRVRML